MFDGELEAEAILALAPSVTLATGGHFESVPDDEELEPDAFGRVKPFLVFSFSDPIPKASGRGLGVGEQSQPHVFGFTVTSVASSAAEMRALAAQVNRVYIGTTPVEGNSGEIVGTGTTGFTQLDKDSKPSRYFRNRHMKTIINLTTPAPVAP